MTCEIFVLGYICSFGPILIDEIYRTNLKFGFGLEYLFWTLYISGYFTFELFLFLHGPIFQFCWLSTDLWHVEHRISWKKVRIKNLQEDIELVVSLFGYMFYFSLLFGFISIGFYKYLFVYIYSLRTELNIE